MEDLCVTRIIHIIHTYYILRTNFTCYYTSFSIDENKKKLKSKKKKNKNQYEIFKNNIYQIFSIANYTMGLITLKKIISLSTSSIYSKNKIK